MTSTKLLRRLQSDHIQSCKIEVGLISRKFIKPIYTPLAMQEQYISEVGIHKRLGFLLSKKLMLYGAIDPRK